MHLVHWNILKHKWICHYAGEETEADSFSGTHVTFVVIQQNRVASIHAIQTGTPVHTALQEHAHAFIVVTTVQHHLQFQSQEKTEVCYDLESGLFKKKGTKEAIHRSSQILFTDTGQMFV